MTDHRVIEELEQVVASQDFPPVSAVPAIRRGSRLRHLRTAKTVAGGAAAVAVVTAVAVGQAARPEHAPPSPAFGDPGSRILLASGGDASEGYPDLVVSRRGTTIEGFGWPLEGMASVSDPDGTVHFPPVSKLDAESMCLPMLIQAAPEVPNDAWRHDGAWIDGFPTRHGLVTTFGATSAGRTYSASCTVPGDYTPAERPDLERVPTPGEDDRILAQCSYQGHIDFGAWEVGASSRVQDTLSAALLSPDGHVGRCVLSASPRQRVTQVSATPVSETDDPPPLLYGGDGTRLLTLSDAVPPGVTDVTVEVGDRVQVFHVTGGVFAATIRLGEHDDPFDTVVRGLDGSGREVFVKDSDLSGLQRLVPVVCFTSVETGNDGC